MEKSVPTTLRRRLTVPQGPAAVCCVQFSGTVSREAPLQLDFTGSRWPKVVRQGLHLDGLRGDLNSLLLPMSEWGWGGAGP